jgi:hypothetical protein
VATEGDRCTPLWGDVGGDWSWLEVVVGPCSGEKGLEGWNSRRDGLAEDGGVMILLLVVGEEEPFF